MTNILMGTMLGSFTFMHAGIVGQLFAWLTLYNLFFQHCSVTLFLELVCVHGFGVSSVTIISRPYDCGEIQ